MSTLRFTCLMLSFAGAVWAQTASLSGTVKDTTGAVLPSAAVTATQVERNLTFRTITDGYGRYVLQDLPVVRYSVSSNATGFKTFSQTAVELTVDQRAVLNVVLEV